VVGAIKSPADDLRNLTLPAEEVLGSRQTRDLTHPAGLNAWVRSIEPDERTAFATTQLVSMTVAVTAERMGLTSRHLVRVFVANVGLTPKSYQRVLRLHRFIAEAEQRPHLATLRIPVTAAADRPPRATRRASSSTPCEAGGRAVAGLNRQ
jgi:AraC-like DNA-binding protein